nr:MAG TPA: hypothetical protein [Caudoviricetes sp.]
MRKERLWQRRFLLGTNSWGHTPLQLYFNICSIPQTFHQCNTNRCAANPLQTDALQILWDWLKNKEK